MRSHLIAIIFCCNVLCCTYAAITVKHIKNETLNEISFLINAVQLLITNTTTSVPSIMVNKTTHILQVITNNSGADLPLFENDTTSKGDTSKSSVTGCGCTIYTCGLPNRENRVLGGLVTDKVEYPWIAYLTYRGKLYCGATLINNQYLITAGHCLHRVPSSRVLIHLGKHHRKNSKETALELKIGEWHIHPDFNRRTFQNDIGIIKLQKPVILTKFVRPICLPPLVETNIYGMYGTVVGWGRTTEKGSSSDFPREIQVPIMTNAECKTKRYDPSEITSNMFCAGYDQGKIDACQGDSGGPLMLERNKTYEISGIVSWGQGCGRKGYPGVYTRVEKYYDFIRKHVPSNCVC